MFCSTKWLLLCPIMSHTPIFLSNYLPPPPPLLLSVTSTMSPFPLIIVCCLPLPLLTFLSHVVFLCGITVSFSLSLLSLRFLSLLPFNRLFLDILLYFVYSSPPSFSSPNSPSRPLSSAISLVLIFLRRSVLVGQTLAIPFLIGSIHISCFLWGLHR